MGSEEVRDVLGRKRTIEILRYLSENGIQNYSDIETAIDTSSDTVSDSLDVLQKYGLVEQYKQSKKDVRYELTQRGEEFLEAYRGIANILKKDSD